MVDRKAYIGSSFVGTQVRTGLKDEELQKILPAIVKVPSTSEQFSDRVEQFFATLRFNVPFVGLPLDITKDANGNPKVPMDYIKYCFAKAHKYVAKNKKEYDADVHKTFYIDDPEESKAYRFEEVELRTKADVEFAKIINDEDKQDFIIRMLSDSIDPEQLDPKTKINTLYQLKDGEFDKFYRIITDPKLEKKAELKSLVAKGILRKDGNMYLYVDTVLGTGEDNALAYLHSPENSAILIQLRAKLEEATKVYKAVKDKRKAEQASKETPSK